MKTGLAKILSFLSTSLVLACLLCCLVMSFFGCFAVRDLFRSGCRQNVANTMAGCNNLVEVIVIEGFFP